MEQKQDKQPEQKVTGQGAVLLKYPKNIRQVGDNSGPAGAGSVRIYVEDYVMSYAMYLASNAKEGCASAILLGQKAMVEGRRTVFIYGAVELPQQWKVPEVITGTQWAAVYDQIQKYFHGIDIVGWFLTSPGLCMTPDEAVHSVWDAGFGGADRLLYLYDNISREDAFFSEKEGEFISQSGYYIYYEKNEEMQNYIIDAKGGKSSDAGYDDTTSKKIREKIEGKNKLSARKRRNAILYKQAACMAGIVASAAILVNVSTKLNQNSLWEDGQQENPEPYKATEAVSNQSPQSVTPVTESSIQEVESVQEKEEEENADSEKEDEKIDKEDSGVDKQEKQNKGKDKNFKKKNSENTEEQYIVKKGDTLESISVSCYGSRRYIKKIKKLNHLKSADKIYIGQKLLLPSA